MVRGWRSGSPWSGAAVLLAVVAAAALGGCDMLAGGRMSQKAQYKFEKGRRVLVLVELRDGVAPPPAFATNLGDQIGGQLWLNKAVDVPPVPQDRLINLQQANPEAYKQMGVADIAKAAGADVVLRVYVTQLLTATTADGNVAEGNAEAFLKVIDSQGTRLWPGEMAGTRLTAHVDMGLLTDRSLADIVKKLSEQLTEDTDHMFHEYTPARHNMPR